MRRGRGADEPRAGGACASSAAKRQEKAEGSDCSNACTAPSAVGENVMPCTDDGWPSAG